MTRVILGFALLATITLGAWTAAAAEPPSAAEARSVETMELGNFSISLAVKDLAVSREFYAKLGFVEIGGDAAQNWLILRNGDTKVGLFQGMFENNIMTFNPGWSQDGENLEEFTDVRELQKRLKAAGITPVTEADEATTGPASVVIMDPDGNMILLDQHR